MKEEYDRITEILENPPNPNEELRSLIDQVNQMIARNINTCVNKSVSDSANKLLSQMNDYIKDDNFEYVDKSLHDSFDKLISEMDNNNMKDDTIF